MFNRILIIFFIFFSFNNTILAQSKFGNNELLVEGFQSEYKACEKICFKIVNISSSILDLAQFELYSYYKPNKYWAIQEFNLLSPGYDFVSTGIAIELKPNEERKFEFDPKKFRGGCLKINEKCRIQIAYFITRSNIGVLDHLKLDFIIKK